MRPDRKDRHGEGKHRRYGHASDAKARKDMDLDSPVMKCFASYAKDLDFRHDKYERVVKLSRDITIESKRIIFLLHSADHDNKKETVLKEAEKRLNTLETTLFKSISEELRGEEPYQYLRAYSAGLQEYVEALTFYHYLMEKELRGWDSIQKKLKYTVKDNSEATGSESEHCAEINLEVLMPPSEYVLGVADLSGELMRNCINSLGSGQPDSCTEACAFVKEIYNGFLSVGNSGPKEFSRKLFTLKQSLNKMENACYAIHVRGSEMPQTLLADVFRDIGVGEPFEEDEGFY